MKVPHCKLPEVKSGTKPGNVEAGLLVENRRIEQKNTRLSWNGQEKTINVPEREKIQEV
jgi:hypothetical protein